MTETATSILGEKQEEKPKLIVGIPKEIFPRERRVAAVPATIAQMRKWGLEVIVESGAGEAASYPDPAYAEAGAKIVDTAELWATADLVLKVRPPVYNEALSQHEAELLREGGRLISFIWPAINKELVQQLAKKKATVLAMDAVPRITRAQKLDALSAMANLSGYKAVVEGASRYGRFLGGQITAAGKIKPAQILIVGAGVAGLAAIGAGKGLGAIVKAFDTRKASKEQVESLGGQFVPFDFTEDGDGSGGYAKEMSEAYVAAEQALLAQHAKDADIIITTALIPGKKAPVLITSGAVVGMKRGSVIIDLAAEQGGNCALTEKDQIVEKFGVRIVGSTDLISQMAPQASELYSVTVLNLLDEILKPGNGFTINMEDEVQRGMIVLHQGELTWPPPQPTIRTGGPSTKTQAQPIMALPPKPTSPWPTRIAATGGVALLTLMGVYGSEPLLQHVTVFLLACIVGWHIVWNVTPALHTPLMSVTNAISGIILIGGLVLSARQEIGLPALLASVALLVATINVAGGFLVTQRMLKMFRK